MRSKKFYAVILTVSAVMLAGCNVNINTPDAAGQNKTEMTEDAGTANEKANADKTQAQETAQEVAEDNADASAQNEPRDASDEIKSIEEDLLSRRYNGFLSGEYRTPEEIQWYEVFYLGAGITTDDFADSEKEIAAKYSEENDYDVYEYGGIDIFRAQDVEKFIKETSGLDLAEVKDSLGLTYYDEWDIYVSASATDTNQVGVSVESAVVDADGVYTVDYESEVPMEVKMKKNGDSWQFISNAWAPQEGRDAAIASLYDEIIRKYCTALNEGWDDDRVSKERICELVTFYAGTPDGADSLGYCLKDLDGDGTDDLIIGEVADGDMANVIYEIYYAKRGNRTKIWEIEAGTRDLFYLADDNTIYESLSDSATDSQLLHFGLRPIAQYMDMVPIDGIIYTESGVAGADMPWYYATGYDYKNADGWEAISEMLFNDYMDRAEKSYVQIDFTPFSQVE